MKKLREKINDFLYPMTTPKALASVFGFGILWWAIGLGVNLMNPDYDYLNPGDQWYHGYTIIVIGTGLFILYFVLRVIRLWLVKPERKTGAKGLLNSEEVVNAIDVIADRFGFWLAPLSLAIHITFTYWYSVPLLEALGGIGVIAGAGLLGWKYLFRVK